MKKQFYLFVLTLLCVYGSANAAVGDTTWVQAFHGQFTHYGNFDTTANFPNGSVSYRKIYMIITIGEYNCTPGSQYCHQWDYDVESYIMTPAGDTLELSRFITPYATSGTPGFNSAWQQHYIFDVTDYYPILKNTATVRELYSGYSWGFTGDVKFAFIEGTPERNVLGYTRLWNSSYTYGNTADPIDNHITADSLNPPAGTVSSELKFAITGHGYDNASGCCEFDNTGVGHTYAVLANNAQVAQFNMNMNCGAFELYPQGGTWASFRAGNWCPGGSLAVAQYKLPGISAGHPGTVDVDFDDSYNGISSFGDYKIASAAFYYAGYNKTVDASLEDIIAPTKFEWYRRENPRASAPVIKVRNTGSTTITSILFQYGVQDSAMAQYIWLGSLAPSADTILTLPALTALTNLSLGLNTGTYGFVAEILQVNGQQDNDQSNDNLTSTFLVAPSWPSQFSVNLLTSSVDVNGNLGSSSPAASDASWQITDQFGAVVASRTGAIVKTTYKDTVNLMSAGFYQLTVSTQQCVGLSWWPFEQPAPNNTPGYAAGSITVYDVNNLVTLPLNGNNTGAYHDDFGCGFTQYFTTLGQCQANTPVIGRYGDSLFASSGVSYQWYKNGVRIPGATNQSYGMTHNDGNYTVQVTDANGCVGTSGTYTVINLGITNLPDQASVLIVPNPATDIFTVTVNSALIGTQYTLTDLTGREMLTGNINSASTLVSSAGLSSGIYLVTVSDGTSAITKRVVVAR